MTNEIADYLVDGVGGKKQLDGKFMKKFNKLVAQVSTSDCDHLSRRRHHLSLHRNHLYL